MQRGMLLAASIVLALCAPPLHAASKRFHDIFRVDRVSASIVQNRLVVEASGAVSSGGWSHPRLRAKPSAPEAAILTLDFITDPPSSKRVVIQELLPVSATIRLPLPKYGTVAVSVVSQSNTITTEIRR